MSETTISNVIFKHGGKVVKDSFGLLIKSQPTELIDTVVNGENVNSPRLIIFCNKLRVSIYAGSFMSCPQAKEYLRKLEAAIKIIEETNLCLS